MPYGEMQVIQVFLTDTSYKLLLVMSSKLVSQGYILHIKQDIFTQQHIKQGYILIM